MAKGISKYSVKEAKNIKLGQGGADYINAGTVDQSSNPGVTWVAFTTLTDPTVVSATSVNTDIWDNLSSVSVPVATTIYGRWSAVTTGSGDVAIVYRG